MSLLKYVERLRYMDYLIRLKRTGNATNFSRKIGVSVSQLKEDISEMRSLGALIEFNRGINSYIYKDGCQLILKFINDKIAIRPVIQDDEKIHLHYYQTKNTMKIKLLSTVALLLTAFCANAQWTTSGSNIYNTNSGNVGIGNTSPDSKLVITRNNWQLKLTNPNSASWDWRIGSSSNDWFSGGQRFVISHTVNSQDATFCIDGSTSSFNVGIGKISPSYKLDVNGAVRATAYYTISDERLKTDIKKISSPLQRITKLNGYTYLFNSKQSSLLKLPQGRQIGLLAQQVESEFPDAVTKDSDGMLAVNYTALIPVMIEAIKELQSELESTKAELKETKLLLQSKAQTTHESNNLEKKAFSISNYPNPSTGVSIFEYDLVESPTPSSIIIKSMEGETMQVLDNLRGAGKIEFNTSTLKSGIYLYSLVVGGKIVHTERMLVK